MPSGNRKYLFNFFFLLYFFTKLSFTFSLQLSVLQLPALEICDNNNKCLLSSVCTASTVWCPLSSVYLPH